MIINFDNWKLCNAIYLSWDDMEVLVNYRLEALLRRKVDARSFTDNGYWEMHIGPITQEELNTIFDSANIDVEEREKHRASASKLCSISDIVTLAVIDCELPFAIENAVPCEDGIALLGKSITYAKFYNHPEVPSNDR